MSGVTLAHLPEIIESIGGSPRPVSVLWQAQDMLVFVARGREHRSEFHIDPSD